jgi:hypothetical protein
MRQLTFDEIKLVREAQALWEQYSTSTQQPFIGTAGPAGMLESAEYLLDDFEALFTAFKWVCGEYTQAFGTLPVVSLLQLPDHTALLTLPLSTGQLTFSLHFSQDLTRFPDGVISTFMCYLTPTSDVTPDCWCSIAATGIPRTSLETNSIEVQGLFQWTLAEIGHIAVAYSATGVFPATCLSGTPTKVYGASPPLVTETQQFDASVIQFPQRKHLPE